MYEVTELVQPSVQALPRHAAALLHVPESAGQLSQSCRTQLLSPVMSMNLIMINIIIIIIIICIRYTSHG